MTPLSYVADVTIGTVAASKALIVDANKELSGLGKLTFASLKTDAGAGNYGATINTGWLELDPGSGGTFGAKLMFSNADTSLNPLYGLGIRCRSNETGAIAVGLNVSGSANHAAAGQILTGEFYLQNAGSNTIVGVYQSSALHVKSWLDAACHPRASALWIDDESDVAADIQDMVDITMNGTIEIDNVFHIYGGDPGADTLFNFEVCDTGTGAFLTADSTALSGLTGSYKIKCKVIDGQGNVTVAYLRLTAT
jgi:hypothetical protein